jgi:hypothetical protein
MRCRVGIATGMAIIGGLSGDGALQHREVIGDAPNLAGRVQLSIQPDIVAIEPATRRLIGNLFDCRNLGTIDTTRGTEPLHIWQVLEDSAIANRFEALRGLALSPLVGRDEEIDVLLRRWASAKAGDGQVVLVSGEPGLGKSRLAAALEERLCAEPHTRLRYQCSPYHCDSVLHPLSWRWGAPPALPQGPGRDATREARSDIGAGAHRGNGTALRFLAVDPDRRPLSAARIERGAATPPDPGGLARPARSIDAGKAGVDAV